MSPYRIGVCSWSLQPENADALAERATQAGVDGVQLALDPIRLGIMGVAEVRARLGEAGVRLLSGMMAMKGEDYSSLDSIRRTGGVAPDEPWPANRAAAGEMARIAGELGIALVSFHAGFIPQAISDPRRKTMLGRLAELAGTYRARGVGIALETGQETAKTIEAFLAEPECLGIGVNFDPANLILYGTDDPVEALARLAPRVTQVHVKDALPAVHEGAWGTEVPVGTGAVDWAAFFKALTSCPAVGALVIERESGNDRVGDVAQARHFLRSVLE